VVEMVDFVEVFDRKWIWLLFHAGKALLVGLY